MATFGSLFSGIGGFDLAFEQAGIKCAWQCEIDKQARSVLARHWPRVPCVEDVRDVTQNNVAAVDLICGGFPCQDLSVAGKRAGLAGERSGLWFEFHRVIEELRPQWVVIENVPGLLSSHRGADFAVILQGLVKLRYGVSWRILDAQYFGVAQRRRRVFIVGSLGDGRSAQVLFEREGLFGHPPTRRAQRQGTASDIAPSLATSGRGTERAGESRGQDPLVVEPISFDWQTSGSERTYIHDLPGRTRNLSASKTLAVAFGGNNTSGAIEIAAAVNAHGGSGRMDFESETFVFEPRFARNGKGAPDTIAPPLKAQNGGTGKGDGAPVVVTAMHETGQGFWQEGEHAGTLRAEGENRLSRPSNVVAYNIQHNDGGQHRRKDRPEGGLYVNETETALTVGTTDMTAVITSGVRRLTPTECERLQGFPDGWTAGQSDSARYRQLGNAVAVPVARWIGQRIVDKDEA